MKNINKTIAILVLSCTLTNCNSVGLRDSLLNSDLERFSSESVYDSNSHESTYSSNSHDGVYDSSSSEFFDSDDKTSDSSDIPDIDCCEDQETKEYWEIQLEEKLETLNNLRKQSSENEVFCFFTDPHWFEPTRNYRFNREVILSDLHRLKVAYDSSLSSFIMCGGDLLNNGDTKSQACFKLSSFVALYNSIFDNPFVIVGNHDTNYQGDTYMNNDFDFESCMLSQTTLNDVLFNGEKSYYSFSTELTSYYCFDSGIENYNEFGTSYQSDQIDWFAKSLLEDKKPHKAVFIHIAFRSNSTKTYMLQNIERIIDAYNSNGKITINNTAYDYVDATGKIHFIQAGHEHKDFYSVLSNGVPVFLTRTFGSPEVATQPTFDIVFSDYSNGRIVFLRIGDGDNREYYLPYTL